MTAGPALPILGDGWDDVSHCERPIRHFAYAPILPLERRMAATIAGSRVTAARGASPLRSDPAPAVAPLGAAPCARDSVGDRKA